MNAQPLAPKSWPAKAIETGSVFLATACYTSFIPSKMVASFRIKWKNKQLTERKWTGAGLVGSFWGVVTHAVLPVGLADGAVVLLLGALTATYTSHVAEKSLGTHDDPRIVIDEWIGAWIAVWMLPQTFGFEVLLAFLLFRILDVWKGPWGRGLQHLPGGLGVVMDDLAAGLLANIVTRIVIFLFYPPTFL